MNCQSFSSTKSPVIFGISETWLKCEIPDREVPYVPSCNIFRHGRTSRGGGVLEYVSERWRSRSGRDVEDDGVECAWVEIRLNKSTVLLGDMYRPPNVDSSLLTNFEGLRDPNGWPQRQPAHTILSCWQTFPHFNWKPSQATDLWANPSHYSQIFRTSF